MVEIPRSTSQRPFKRALVIEDVRLACADLRARGYHCDRIAHDELLTHIGTEYFVSLHAGGYHLLWVSTPADWYVRAPGRRMGPRWQKTQHM